MFQPEFLSSKIFNPAKLTGQNEMEMRYDSVAIETHENFSHLLPHPVVS